MEMSKKLLLGLSLWVFIASTANAGLILDLNNQPTLQYGDFFSFSLALNHNLFVSGLDSSNPGPNSPFYISSSEGHIKDEIVIGTGAEGQDVNQNFDGMDDAYDVASGSETHTDTVTLADPPTLGGTGTDPASDSALTWDADVAAIRDFLDPGANFAIVFDHNETAADSDSIDDGFNALNALSWGKITLFGSDTMDPIDFFVSAYDDPFTLADERTAGLFASASGAPDPTNTNPGETQAPFDPRWGIIHGAFTLNPDGSLAHFGAPTQAEKNNGFVEISGNLGDDQAEFVIFNPLLDALIKDSDYTSLSFEFKLARQNNGPPNIFVLSDTVVRTGDVIPEPASMAVWSLLGFAGFAGLYSRRRQRRTVTA